MHPLCFCSDRATVILSTFVSTRMTHQTIQLDSTAPAASHLTEPHLRLGWRIVLTLLLLLLISLLSLLYQPSKVARAAPAGRPLVQSTTDPLVLAFYYSWFDENSWNYDQLSDVPAQLYASRDRVAMGRHIDQAKAAGIDAFLVAWYGPGGDSNQTEANLAALLEEAAARNFKIGILFETDSPFLGSVDSISAALQHAMSVHGSHPAYLHADGKPVIFFWRPGLYASGTWSAIRSKVDPDGAALWIGEGVDAGILTVFDGLYLYSNTWNPPTDLIATNQKFARLVENARQATGAPKQWVATVMPGYNDVRIRPSAGFVREREDGAYYAQSWQAAIASRPNWVVITSFNEWPEGTHIEPSATYGDQYLGLTAQWSGQFKVGGGTATTVAGAAAASSVVVVPDAEPDLPTAYVTTELLNLRAGPGTTYALLGQVSAGRALPIIGRQAEQADWWQVQTDYGAAWVFGDLVRAAGPLDSVPVVGEVQPAASESTETEAVAPAGLTLTIGNRSVTLRSIRTTNP